MSLLGEILYKLGSGAAKAKPAPLPQAPPVFGVDVVTKLEGLAKANPQKLNWKTSIIDLLKLLDLDSSLADRMGDSAAMNIWLHKTLLRKLAENVATVRVTCWAIPVRALGCC